MSVMQSRFSRHLNFNKLFLNFSTNVKSVNSSESGHYIQICNEKYKTDPFNNLSTSILQKINVKLLKNENHPLTILKSLIEDHFEKNFKNQYKAVDNLLNPVVTAKQNFDDLFIHKDHPGRAPTDTYYINENQLLRTHTSAHQREVLSSKLSDGYLISADVYRRDEIDVSHYPVFHQMEGIKLFSKSNLTEESKIQNSVTKFNIKEEKKGGPIQTCHDLNECDLVVNNLKKSLEGLIKELFKNEDENLQIRWIEAFFPFTSPSWEMEVLFRGKWLELCGCGVIQQEILNKTGNGDKVGWAFGLGLERIAMVLFNIPDIRLFWSQDERFLSQFKKGQITQFQSFSKYPSCYKDISFWLGKNKSDTNVNVHDNEIFDVVRDAAGDLAEDVKLIDEFTHPKTGRKSKCYRINYCSLNRTFTNAEVDEIQNKVKDIMLKRFDIELR
ncbi:hypothetical protein HDU92_002520 [Lobulomyces angularis]|nr:hypothetical protein HDU92_002520 [Lobulomyces angularis]